jgi:hypothetical protein
MFIDDVDDHVFLFVEGIPRAQTALPKIVPIPVKPRIKKISHGLSALPPSPGIFPARAVRRYPEL